MTLHICRAGYIVSSFVIYTTILHIQIYISFKGDVRFRVLVKLNICIKKNHIPKYNETIWPRRKYVPIYMVVSFVRHSLYWFYYIHLKTFATWTSCANLNVYLRRHIAHERQNLAHAFNPNRFGFSHRALPTNFANKYTHWHCSHTYLGYTIRQPYKRGLHMVRQSYKYFITYTRGEWLFGRNIKKDFILIFRN